jgi:hypothetical protein
MDCYRQGGETERARELSEEVIRASTDFDRKERWPMRIAEAEITLGVVAAREGDLDEAVVHGRRALAGSRQSIPGQSFADVGRRLRRGLPRAAAR